MTTESRLAIVVDSRGAKADTDALAKAMEGLEEAGVRVSTSATKAGKSSQDAGRAYRRAGSEAERASQGVDRINRSLDKTDDSAAKAALALRRALIGGFAGITAMGLIDQADSWGQYASRIRMATQSAEEYETVQARMLQSANATYRNIDETRESFIQLSPVLRQMGMDLGQSLDAIDAFSGLLVVNAASADRAQAAQRALGVALQKGKLDADGWITIYSTLDSLVEVLAEHSGKSGEEIRKLGASGKLSVNMLAQALSGQYGAIMKQVQDMPTTVRDAMQNVANAFREYIGTANEARGVTAGMAAGLNLLGENLDSVLNVAIIAATAGLARYTAGLGVAAVQSNFKANVARQAAVDELRLAQAHVAATQAALAQAQASALLGGSQAAAVGRAEALAAAQLRLAAAQRVATVATTSLLGLLGGPVGLALTVGLTAAAFVSFSSAASASRSTLAGLTGSVDTAISKFRELGVLQREAAMTELTKKQAEQAQEASRAVSEFVDGLSPTTSRGAAAVAKMRADMRAELQAVVSDTSLSSSNMQQAMAGLIDSWAASGRISQEQAVKYRAAAAAVAESQSAAQQTAQRISELSSEQQRLASSANQAASAQGTLNAALRETDEAGKTYLENLQGRALTAGLDTQRKQLEALVKAGKLVFTDSDLTSAQKAADTIDRANKLTKDTKAANSDEGKRYIEQLRERVALIGKETEYEQLLARIGSGSIKFRTDAAKREALALAQTQDYLNQQVETQEILRDLKAQQSVTETQFMRDLAGLGQGDRVREINASLAQVEDRYRDLIEQRRNSPRGLSDSELRQIQDSLSAELAMVRGHYAARWDIERDWRLGALDGLRNYSDEAKNAYASMAQSVRGGFDAAGDALVDWAFTADRSFGDTARSYARMVASMMVKQQVLGPLAGLLGNALSVYTGVGQAGISTSGFNASSSLTQLIGFDRGGYTGDGGRLEPAGVVHRGEGVLNQDEIAALGGEQGFNALRKAIRDGARSDPGTKVIGAPAIVSGASTSSALKMSLHFYGQGQQETNAPAGYEGFAEDIGRYIDQRFQQLQSRSYRQGGAAWNAKQGRM